MLLTVKRFVGHRTVITTNWKCNNHIVSYQAVAKCVYATKKSNCYSYSHHKDQNKAPSTTMSKFKVNFTLVETVKIEPPSSELQTVYLSIYS